MLISNEMVSGKKSARILLTESEVAHIGPSPTRRCRLLPLLLRWSPR